LKFALKFAYNGKNFYGYARQPGLKTIEGKVINALVANEIIQDTKKSLFRSASRTDKGVSAICNVVSFNSSKEITNILNLLTFSSKDIIFYGIKKVKDDFNPRYEKNRHYRYYLRIKNLDLEKILSTLELFNGEHDFSNFARVERNKNPIRIIENIICEIKNGYLIIDFFGPNFLRNQIRRIISAAVKVGKEKIKKVDVKNALYNPEKPIDFNVVKADPLILKDIIYDFKFDVFPSELKKVKKLEEKIISNL